MGVRTLIVDDSAFMREIIRQHLELLGCQIVGEAENAAQALQLFSALKPDLVTIDVVMPQVGGVDAIGAFRKMRQENPRLPVLVMTAMPFNQTRDVFLAEGAVDYLVKPLTAQVFKQTARKLKRLFPQLRDVEAS
jgi:two-component system chemotaxis response regulator CheY